jgi:hypothetical protein
MDIHQLDAYLGNLTPHQFKIMQVMYDAGDEWLSRAMVAKRLNKRRLTPYDINCLTMLSEKNILEISTKPTTAPGSDFAYIYKMPDETAELIQEWTEIRDQNQAENNTKKARKPINLRGNK